MADFSLSDYKEGLSYAVSYCSRAEHSAREVRDKLRQYGLGREDEDRVIAYLQEEKFIDHARYARLYCESKIKSNHWGRIKLSLMLKSKGIEKEIISEALNNIDEEEYMESLRTLAERKLRALHISDLNEKKYRLRYFLCSHGYERELADGAINDLLQ